MTASGSSNCIGKTSCLYPKELLFVTEPIAKNMKICLCLIDFIGFGMGLSTITLYIIQF